MTAPPPFGGYLLVTPPIRQESPLGSVTFYHGLSRYEVWPDLDLYFLQHKEKLPEDVRRFLYDIFEPNNTLHVTPHAHVVKRLIEYATEIKATQMEVLLIDVFGRSRHFVRDDSCLHWLGFEPVSRGEWSLLSVLYSSPLLADWWSKINVHGLLDRPEDCRSYADDYIRLMSRENGPEPIAEPAIIDVLRVANANLSLVSQAGRK